MPLKGRDAFDLMNREGEHGMRKAIVQLAEDNSAIRMQLKECSQTMLQMAKTIEALTDGTVKLRDKVREIDERFNPKGEYDA